MRKRIGSPPHMLREIRLETSCGGEFDKFRWREAVDEKLTMAKKVYMRKQTAILIFINRRANRSKGRDAKLPA